VSKILKIRYRAGSNFDAAINLAKDEFGIDDCQHHSSHIDVKIWIELNDGSKRTVAVECKGTDLHKSLFGKGEGGILETELNKHYLPERDFGIVDEIWIFVGHPYDYRDLCVLDSLVAKHRLIKKSYGSIGAAVDGMFRYAQSLDDKHDYMLGQYINSDKGVPMMVKMLRLFPGITEAFTDEIKLFILENPPEDFLPMVKTLLPKNSNVQRLWWDWFYGGIEPVKNKVGD
jgi:hypothetical protein